MCLLLSPRFLICSASGTVSRMGGWGPGRGAPSVASPGLMLQSSSALIIFTMGVRRGGGGGVTGGLTMCGPRRTSGHQVQPVLGAYPAAFWPGSPCLQGWGRPRATPSAAATRVSGGARQGARSQEPRHTPEPPASL